MNKQILFPIILSVLLAGCGRVSESTLNEILDKDPAFGRILNEKKRIDTEIGSLTDNFNKQKSVTDTKIDSLREVIKVEKESLHTRIASLKEAMTPEVFAIKERLQEKRSEYKLRAGNLKGSIAKLKNISKLLKKKDELSLSGDETSVWKKRLQGLDKEIISDRQNLERLRAKIRLLKTELAILKE